MRSRILFISGCQKDAKRLSEMLHALPLKLEHVRSLDRARTRLEISAPTQRSMCIDGLLLQSRRSCCTGREQLKVGGIRIR